MDKLNHKAQENLSILLNLNKEDNLISENGKLQLQDDYVQVENTTELEYSIYLTLNQLLFWNDYKNIYHDNIFEKLDQCIDTIYGNDQLNHLIETSDLKIIINDIDEKLDLMKERYFYQSPFFTCFKNTYRLFNIAITIFKENDEIIKKMTRIAYLHKKNDDNNDDNDNDNDDNNDDDNDDNDDNYDNDYNDNDNDNDDSKDKQE